MKISKLISSACFVSSIFLHFCLLSFSQKNEFNGYYIKNNSDTVKGNFTNYRQWNNNPDKVSFTPVQTGSQIELTPDNCLSFHVSNYDIYLAYHGSRLTNPIMFNATTTSNSSDTKDTVKTFLRQIASTDKYKFYIFKDQLRINLYYSEGNLITELVQKAALINDVFWQSMTYKQQLKALFIGREEKINDLTYTEESISEFVNRLESAIAVPKKIKKKNNGIFISAGISMNSFKFTKNQSIDATLRDYPNKTVPLVQIGYILALNRNFGRIFFLPQLTVFSFKHSASVTYNNAYPVFINTFQSSPVITLAFHFGYNIINTHDFKLSIQPGGGFSLLSKNQEVDEVKVTASDTRTNRTNLERATSSIDIKTMALVSNKYVAWVAYNFPSSVASLAASNGRLTAIQLGLGYKF